ncbi:hypothetical protein ACHWQZ_G002798 [Mnemiopsis leidyi]
MTPNLHLSILLVQTVFCHLVSSISPLIDSSYDLFKYLKYENIDYLQETEWHGFWNKRWDGYQFNNNNFNSKRVTPSKCDASKDLLDCSKISPSETLVEINQMPVVNITSYSFPASNSITVLRLISLPKLVNIDDEVFDKLLKLQKIIIVGTSIRKVPQFNKKMVTLELVDLFNNEVKSVPDEAFVNCPNLKQINLGQNAITFVSNSAFAGTKLELLTFHHNKLEQVPAINGVKDTIKYLGLEHNKISSVGNYSLQSVSSLQHINISYNPISHFEHDCISSLPNLRFLELLSMTEEIEIPFHFLSRAQKIEHVTLDYSKKVTFSGRAVEITPSLLGFSARGCGITGLDFRSIQGTSNLERLWLDFNKLSTVQHSMFIHGSFPNLKRLYLNNNEIRDIEWFGNEEFIDRTLIVKKSLKFFNTTSFDGMSNLEILCLKNNKISQIRNNAFLGLRNLQELYLSDNILDDDSIEDDAFKGLSGVQILTLDDNLLRAVPNAVYSLESLSKLSMRKNKLTFISAGDFGTLENLTFLDLDNNRILLIENKAFSSTLLDLRLSHNEFDFIDVEVFHELTNLQTLMLSSNRISFLPKDVFTKNTELESIYLDNNFLKFINSSHFSNNKLSEDLVLNGNQIAYIGEGSFSSVKTAANILLHDNELYDLPSDGMFHNLVVRWQIRLDNNRLTRIKANTFSNITCSYLKINNNEITEIESNAFNKITVLETFDISNNPIRKLNSLAFNDIVVKNRAIFTNLKPLRAIPSFAFNKFTARSTIFSNNSLEIIETKGFNEVEIAERLVLQEVGLRWIDRLAIVGSVDELYFQGNQIEKIPERALYHVAGNSKLYLQNNIIQVIESNSLPNSEEAILLQNNSISLLTQSMFGNNDKTKFLSLKSNKISRLETNIFTGMLNLDSLDLGENKIDEIPDNMFSGLEALQTLNLNDNLIRYLGNQVDLASLQQIILDDNQLSGMSSNIVEPGTVMKIFKLNNNKLSCGCGLFTAATPIKTAIQNASCETPSHLTDVKLNWEDKENGRYFTKIPTETFVCEPIDVTTEKVDETSFTLSWDPPVNIQYGGTTRTNYCFHDGCVGTQISYSAYCENMDGDGALDETGLTSNRLTISHDTKLPYYCRVTLHHHTTTGVMPSSWSQVVSYKREVPKPDELVCLDGDRCYRLSAEYYKISRDFGLFNNYGPSKMVNSPNYRRTLMLNYLYKKDPQDSDDNFVPWFGPSESQNVYTKSELVLPTAVPGGYKASAERFYPVPDTFNQNPRDCDFNVRPLGFTAKLFSSLVRTNSEVLKLGSVDEGWVYFGGVLLVELIAPEGNTEEVCTEILLLEEEARVWIGVMVAGDCQVDKVSNEGKLIKVGQATKLEIFISQRRNCESKLYLEMQNFNLVPETDNLNQEPTFIFETTEEKPIKGFIATMELQNPFTSDEYTIEILNDNRFFYFVDNTFDFAPDLARKVEVDPGYGVPPYVPFKSEPPLVPLPEKSRFTVRNHNASLALAKELDYRYSQELSVTYRITGSLPNGSTITATGLILIKITDYNDNWPVAGQTVYTWDGLKDALSVQPLEITATDEDTELNSELEYYIGKVDRPADEEDYKKKKDLYLYEKTMLNYQIAVHVLDKGTPRLGQTTLVNAAISASCVMTLDFEINSTAGEFYVKAPGYYLSANHRFCDPCEAGYYCYGYGTRAKCTTCTQEIMQPDGSTTVFAEDPDCDRNKTEFSFGGASDCSACKKGWTCVDGTTSPILDETKYIEDCTEEKCPEPMECPNGAACRNGIKIDCDPGTAGNGRVCTFCPPGRFSNQTNSRVCQCCPAGYESSHKKSRCEPCAFNERSEDCEQCSPCRNRAECPCLEENPCYPGVQCVNVASGDDNFTCLECPYGTEGDGKVCRDINECDVEGACFRGCVNKEDGYECEPCPDGYSGSTPSGIGKEYAENNKQNCTDINECLTDNGKCGDHVICHNRIGEPPECGDCEEGYALAGTSSGVKICERSNQCEEEDACAGNATCIYIRPLSYACFCDTGFAGDGRKGGECGVDSDADGFPDYALNCAGPRCKKDNCPDIPNISQRDEDNDFIGDACDPDIDEDGLPNDLDLCPYSNVTTDEDKDGDGVGDICDNCPEHYNPGQLNADRDEWGDACDDDKDNDGYKDDQDNCDYIANDPKDTDRDGVGDKCDNCWDRRQENPGQEDDDWNGVGDICDDGLDFDGDGIIDSVDNCPMFSDATQNNRDLDSKVEASHRRRSGDICDYDLDDDQIDNDVDPCPYFNGDVDVCRDAITGPDADGDGVPDYLDTSPWSEIIGQSVDFFSMKAPWKSFVFDGVKRDESGFSWKYDDKNASFSNEFYQLREFPAPFVGILFYRSDDVDIFGTWFVKGDTPGNYIGIVFGFQSARKFFLVQWRRDHKAYLNAGGLRGLHIKAVHTTKGELIFGEAYSEMLWHTGSQGSQSTLLWYDRNKVPWRFNQAYRWFLKHRPSVSVFELVVYEAGKVIIQTGPIHYNRILGGSFGVYAFSQPFTYWSNIKYQAKPRSNRALSLSSTPSFGETEKTFTPMGESRGWTYNWKSLEYREKNSGYSLLWVNFAIEYILPTSTVRLYINGNQEMEYNAVDPADFLNTDLFLGDRNFSSPVKIDELRVVKGRLERPDELGTLISDPQLEKYRAQQRILLWYDMNEDMSSDTLVDKSGNGFHSKLEDPTIRTSSRSESFLYNLQHNKNYLTSYIHRRPSHAEHDGSYQDSDLGATDDFETVSSLFSASPRPGNSTGGIRKRRKRRHASMHSEL